MRNRILFRMAFVLAFLMGCWLPLPAQENSVITGNAKEILSKIEDSLKRNPGKWVNSGISKGGQTTMYHRRFYPEDVDASVCYVAPLNFSDEDPRVYSFLATVGSRECREKIEQFQKLVLRKKDELLPLYEEYAKKKNYTFKIGLEAALEYSVLEYSFSFWQWQSKGCSEIPGEGATDREIFDHFMAVSGPFYFSDQGISRFSIRR